ncbi:MAG TPA: hypothetical protein VEA69_22985 [Tepidisphaeraceae bacterium]|nr:hypothetical protein [Tepidisphaeraceae bacterium]
MYLPFSSVCDDFYVNMRLATQLPLPHNRETILHFFERVQKRFPEMTRFRKYDNGDLAIEESRDADSYRWVTLEAKRLCAGHVNPESLDDALKIHGMLLEQAPYDLGLSPVEVDYLDILFGFDLSYRGNHDEIIAQSLFADSPLHCLLEGNPDAKAVDIQPSLTVALSEDCRLQARIDIVTRTNSYQVRTGDYSNDVISVYCVVRRYWGDRPKAPMHELIKDLAARAEDLCVSQVIPKVIQPISAAIAAR